MVINPIIFIINDYEHYVDYTYNFDKIIVLNLCCNYFLGLFQANKFSRNNTYDIDKVRCCIFVYALMKIIQYNYDDYII